MKIMLWSISDIIQRIFDYIWLLVWNIRFVAVMRPFSTNLAKPSHTHWKVVKSAVQQLHPVTIQSKQSLVKIMLNHARNQLITNHTPFAALVDNRLSSLQSPPQSLNNHASPPLISATSFSLEPVVTSRRRRRHIYDQFVVRTLRGPPEPSHLSLSWWLKGRSCWWTFSNSPLQAIRSRAITICSHVQQYYDCIHKQYLSC